MEELDWIKKAKKRKAKKLFSLEDKIKQLYSKGLHADAILEYCEKFHSIQTTVRTVYRILNLKESLTVKNSFLKKPAEEQSESAKKIQTAVSSNDDKKKKSLEFFLNKKPIDVIEASKQMGKNNE